MQHQLVVLDRGAQLGEQAEAVGGVGVALGRVGGDAAAAALGVVHGDVGALEQPADVRAVLGVEGDADARLELDGHAAERERAPQRVLQPAWPRRCTASRPGGARDEHGELVAAEPGERVAAPQRGAEALGDLDQQRVAVVVAERVVDLLEAVEVDQQHRGRVVAAQRALGAAVQERAVGQAGEGVVQGLVAQAARRAGDDPEQGAEEEHQAAAEQDHEQQHVLADLLATRPVAHVDLEHAVRIGAGREPHRHEDLEHPLARAVVVHAGLELAHDLAGERRVDVVGVERAAFR